MESNNSTPNTADVVFSTLRSNVPLLFEAFNYIERYDRIEPTQALHQMKDILHHLKDIAEEPNDPENIQKNIIEIKEHFRRGISESYQEHFDYIMSHLFQTYGKYRKTLSKFEMLLGLFRKHRSIHEEVKRVINKAEEYWIEARNNKTNDVDTPKFQKSIELYKNASDLALTIEDNVYLLYNNFYKRSTYFMFLLIGIISALILLFVK